MNARLIVCALIAANLAAAGSVSAEDKLPPIKPIERLLPPKGVDIGQSHRDKLEARLAEVTKALAEAKLDAELKPDVEAYTKAVRWALDFDEFYDVTKDVAKAHAALITAHNRLEELKQNPTLTAAQTSIGPSWQLKRGLIVRGYRSDIDDSVQPYGLHIPENLDLTKPVPLLVWLHGRGDKETDLHFIANREKNKGEFAPDWCITLHPYGRGTIGFKFAGEIDVLDAIESVKKRYKIDEDRIALAGFSMGGAGAWHIGAHYADRFCVVHAGAGFVETAKYNKLTPDKYPAWYEQKLWGWYDVPCYTRNLFNVPVIAYSGENDKQKQAADLMAEAFKAEGRELRHIIGPGVEHKYEAKAKEQVLAEIKAAVEKGRDKWPKKVSLQTRTMSYARHYWVSAWIKQEWEDSWVDAEWKNEATVAVTTQNICELELRLAPSARGKISKVAVTIDGQTLSAEASGDYPSVSLIKHGDAWKVPKGDERGESQRYPQWAGPIDAAFMHPFVVVLPTGEFTNERVQRWVKFEQSRFLRRWRELFRGNCRIKKDTELSNKDQFDFNLILWGDPESNQVIKDFGKQLTLIGGMPLQWSADRVSIGEHTFTASNHIPILFWPACPRDPDEQASTQLRRVILNSGPTFREGHDRTNSQQTPKLPDWAIVGLDKDPDAFSPGTIKAAGFFDENWKVKKEEK